MKRLRARWEVIAALVTFLLLVFAACASSRAQLTVDGESCTLPAGVSTDVTSSGCYALVLTATTLLSEGGLLTQNACAAGEYGLSCRGSAFETPAPPASLGCTMPAGEGYGPEAQYCCPCVGARVGDGG